LAYCTEILDLLEMCAIWRLFSPRAIAEGFCGIGSFPDIESGCGLPLGKMSQARWKPKGLAGAHDGPVSVPS
jgi:hypothetical protein